MELDPVIRVIQRLLTRGVGVATDSLEAPGTLTEGLRKLSQLRLLGAISDTQYELEASRLMYGEGARKHSDS